MKGERVRRADRTMEIRICKTDEQLARLADLASAIWHEYFAPLLSVEQIDYMVQQYQSLEALTRAVRQEGYTYFLGYEGEELVGYCGVKPDGDRLFLSKLYLRSDMRGKHLSTLLLNRAVELAKKEGKRAIYLTCNKYNTHSLDVYHAKGFRDIDAVVTDIGHGFVMDDYILQLDL